MSDLQQLIQYIKSHQKQNRLAISTVVAKQGSSYRKPGARMVINEEGDTFGMIGGGCFDEDVQQVAYKVIRDQKPRLKQYDLSGDDPWDLGLGCNGSVYILVESLDSDLGKEWMAQMDTLFSGKKGLRIRHEFSIPLDFLSGQTEQKVEVNRVFTTALSEDAQKPFTDLYPDKYTLEEFIPPQPRLLVFGAGRDAVPVVELASKSGFEVIVIDHRKEMLAPQRFPPATQRIVSRPTDYQKYISLTESDYVLFMTHHIEYDARAFEFCSQFDVNYFGFLGPVKRTNRILNEIVKIDQEFLATIKHKIYGPVGLDLKADTPEQVAISIVAELLAISNQCQPTFLSTIN